MAPFEKTSYYHRAVCSAGEAETYRNAELLGVDDHFEVLFFESGKKEIKKLLEWRSALLS